MDTNISGIGITSTVTHKTPGEKMTTYNPPADPHPNTALTQTPSSTSKAASIKTIQQGGK